MVINVTNAGSGPFGTFNNWRFTDTYPQPPLTGGGSSPSVSPSVSPSSSPSVSPSQSPSASVSPSVSPSSSPSVSPSQSPSASVSPSASPSASPSVSPSQSPSASKSPSVSPSISPSASPSASPSVSPSQSPSASVSPSASPSISPSASPSISPSQSPSGSVSPSLSPSVSPSVSPSIPPGSHTQIVSFVGADPTGTVQGMNVGKDDDSIPIYYELETQELEFDNRALIKLLEDKFGVIAQNAFDSKIQIRDDNNDFKDIQINLGKRVNTTTLPHIKTHYATIRWSGVSTNKSPILESFYFSKVTNQGILYG